MNIPDEQDPTLWLFVKDNSDRAQVEFFNGEFHFVSEKPPKASKDPKEKVFEKIIKLSPEKTKLLCDNLPYMKDCYNTTVKEIWNKQIAQAGKPKRFRVSDTKEKQIKNMFIYETHNDRCFLSVIVKDNEADLRLRTEYISKKSPQWTPSLAGNSFKDADIPDFIAWAKRMMDGQ